MVAKTALKIVCTNPHTQRKMSIDAEIYDLFSKVIYHILKENKQGITYSDIVVGVKKCFKEKKADFKRSVEWYSVTVKNDMEANNILETFMKKGKKLHRLKI